MQMRSSVLHRGDVCWLLGLEEREGEGLEAVVDCGVTFGEVEASFSFTSRLRRAEIAAAARDGCLPPRIFPIHNATSTTLSISIPVGIPVIELLYGLNTYVNRNTYPNHLPCIILPL